MIHNLRTHSCIITIVEKKRKERRKTYYPEVCMCMCSCMHIRTCGEDIIGTLALIKSKWYRANERNKKIKKEKKGEGR